MFNSNARAEYNEAYRIARMVKGCKDSFYDLVNSEYSICDPAYKSYQTRNLANSVVIAHTQATRMYHSKRAGSHPRKRQFKAFTQWQRFFNRAEGA